VKISPKELEVVKEATKRDIPQVQKKDHMRSEDFLMLWLSSLSSLLKRRSSGIVDIDTMESSVVMILESKTESKTLPLCVNFWTSTSIPTCIL